MAEYARSMPIREDEPLESEEKTQSIGTVSTLITFSQDIMGLEIANNSTDATIYLNISGNAASLSTGIPIYAKGYYAADKKVKQNIGISLISNKLNTDVRIVGHYHLDVEE